MADDLDPAAVERAVGVVTAHQRTSQGYCSHDDCHRAWVVWTSRHVVQSLAAAGLLVTPEHDAQVAARAGDEGHRVGWEHCRDGDYGNDYWDDDTPNPYHADRIERQEQGR